MSSFLQSSKMFKCLRRVVEIFHRLPRVVRIRISLPFYEKLRAVIPFTFRNYSLDFVFFNIVNYVWWWWWWSREGVRCGVWFEERDVECQVYSHCCREVKFVCYGRYF